MIGIKKLFGLLFVFVLLQGVLSPTLSAQVPDSCLQKTDWQFPTPILFGWFYFGPYPGTFAYQIARMVCTPPPPPGHCPFCGSPISLTSGNTYIAEKDFAIPGLGGGLSLNRTWNSLWPSSLPTQQTGIFGPNWRSTYEEQIVLGTDNFVRYVRSDGTSWAFGAGSGSAASSWVVSAPANVAVTLNTDTSTHTYFTLTFQNGEQRRFDGTNGKLIAIIDRNGNTTTVAYDSSGRLSTVTDAVSRTLTFTYGSGTNLVTSVSSSVGISFSYSYDSQGRLSQVTKPDQTTVSFTYNSQSLITTVTDSNGKTLEAHTYDSSGRGLTSSRAGGVEAVTLTYQ